MKWIKHILILSAIAYITVALNSGCETPISQIVPYSGDWKFVFTNSNGSALANSFITIQDTGAFCGKLTVTSNNDVFYIQGDVSGDGSISGGFANDCSGSVSGKINGTFTELMGAGFASGTFTDTLHNPNYKGTWQAKRN